MRRRFFTLALCATLLGALWLVPLTIIDHGASLCLFRNVTGHDCPGCGMTRAIFHALHGDFTTAMRYNWRVVIVMPLLLTITTRALWRCAKYGGTVVS